MKTATFISPCIIINSNCGDCASSGVKKKCCKKYKKKGKSNCKRCPKL